MEDSIADRMELVWNTKDWKRPWLFYQPDLWLVNLPLIAVIKEDFCLGQKRSKVIGIINVLISALVSGKIKFSMGGHVSESEKPFCQVHGAPG